MIVVACVTIAVLVFAAISEAAYCIRPCSSGFRVSDQSVGIRDVALIAVLRACRIFLMRAIASLIALSILATALVSMRR